MYFFLDINEKIISLLTLIKEQNSQILNLVQKQQSVADCSSFDKELPFSLPLKTVDEVIDIEQVLECEETFNLLVNVFLYFNSTFLIIFCAQGELSIQVGR